MASSNASKAALKMKKKREAKKAKKAELAASDSNDTSSLLTLPTRDHKPPATNGLATLLPADSEIDDPEKLKN